MTTSNLSLQYSNVVKDYEEILREYAIDVFTRFYCKETVKTMPDKHTENEDIMTNFRANVETPKSIFEELDEEIEKNDAVQKEVKSVINDVHKNDFEKFLSDLIVFEVTGQKTILITFVKH